MVNQINKDFTQYYTSLEKLLNEACIKANKETNADILQAISDLHNVAKFVTIDLEEFSEILDSITEYVAKDNVKNEELD